MFKWRTWWWWWCWWWWWWCWWWWCIQRNSRNSCSRGVNIESTDHKSSWLGVPLVLFVLTDGERDGLWWPALPWHWLSCTGFPQYLLNVNCLKFNTIVHLPRMFRPTDFIFEKQIGLVFVGLLYIMFTYYTQDTQQECCRLSNWFSLRCVGPWMNRLPPVWWFNFRFMFLNKSWCVRLK